VVVSQRKSVAAVLVFAAIVSLFLPARHRNASALKTTSTPHRTLRVGLVFDVGGRGDKSFNDSAYEGLVRAQSELGAIVEYVEPSDSDDRTAALRLLASRGFDRVIGIGYIFSRDVDEVARDYPNVRFACIDYAPAENGEVPSNVVGLRFREEEGSFLVGALAGLHSQSHAVGFVGGMDIPLIRRFEHGFHAGVASTCPGCRFVASYAGSTPSAFKDPEKGAALATAQYSSGVDVIFHASGSTGHGVFVAAQRLGRQAIGVDSDQYDDMPGVVVTSMLKRVDVAVFQVALDASEGHFQRGDHGIRTFGLVDGGVDYVHTGRHAHLLNHEHVARVESLRADIVAGRIRVPSE
jgi:basic membrane protein A and related proteins